jgi:alkylhydroperoxidase/carboxymuconolactone decarboxylase family protein YurZ
VTQYRINELPFHLKFALQNAVTREEVIEAIAARKIASAVRTSGASPSAR